MSYGEVETGKCINSIGSYVCDCNQGFKNRNELDSDCIDIDECVTYDRGFNNSYGNCINTPGSYRCECKDGYENKNNNDSESCQDIDECMTEVESYEPVFCQDGTCSNYPGGYNCTCLMSFDFLAYDNGPNQVPLCGNHQYTKIKKKQYIFKNMEYSH